MRRWERRTLGILALGGGAIGLAGTLPQEAHVSGLVDLIGVNVFSTLYAFGMWCGIGILEDQPRAIRDTLFFWLLQVPAIVTYGLTYFFWIGFHVTVVFPTGQGSMNFVAGYGTGWQFSMFTTPDNSLVGVNLLALAMVLYLCVQLFLQYRYRCSQAANLLRAIPPVATPLPEVVPVANPLPATAPVVHATAQPPELDEGF